MTFNGCEQRERKVIVTAHRGASGLAPENTIAAFQKAMEYKADFSELDVTMTKDGELILLHDDTLQQTTNDSGNVWDFTLSELKKLDAGSWFGADFVGEHLPTLAEVIDLVNGKMKLNIEIKISGREPGIADKVVETVRHKNFSNQCIITSFDSSAITRVMKIAPEIPAGLIFSNDPAESIFEGKWSILSAKHKIVDADFMNKARAAGKEVHVWTVNKEDDMKRFIDLGVDGIITNFPNRLVEVLEMLNF
jgi:glycerophosphoryl diester phosphodiesterase